MEEKVDQILAILQEANVPSRLKETEYRVREIEMKIDRMIDLMEKQK